MNNRTQNVLVVGGGSGIGLAIARGFSDDGCSVAIAGRDEEKLAAAVRNSPHPLQHHAVDVASRDSVGALVAWFRQSIGTIDIFVNAAGTNIKNRTMAEMRPEQWDQILSINATGAYNCLFAILPEMRERRSGLIFNISSISGKRASELGGVAYCASKFAMTALGTAVGQEEAEYGIRITSVFPGEVDTPILEQRPSPVSDEHRARILQPQDVADVVLALAKLPTRAHVPEIVIKPTWQSYI